MQELDQILSEASSKISEAYFRLSVHNAQAVYRERVYCYELYHQLRSIWPDTPYFLNGEVDKQGHPVFPEAAPKPDFLIHRPGTTENYAVIEVKSCNARPKGISKDIDTLKDFRSKGYLRAIYLIYGTKSETVGQRIRKLLDDYGIEIWVHVEPGGIPKVIE